MRKTAIYQRKRPGDPAWYNKWVQSPPWMFAFAGVVLACLVLYAVSVVFGHDRGSSAWGWGYGIAATVMLALVMAYSVRRRSLGIRRLGRSWTYLELHVYGGMIFLLLVAMHTSFRVPQGVLTLVLWLLSLWVVGTGLFGVFLQKWIPTVLNQGLSVEVHYARIPQLVREAAQRAEELAARASEPVRDFYGRVVAPRIRGVQPRWMYYVDAPGDTHAEADQFAFLRSVVTGEDREVLDDIEVLYRSKLEMDAHYTLQRALRWWLQLHVPAAVALWAVLMLHVTFVLLY
jgi:hypothetical protein